MLKKLFVTAAAAAAVSVPLAGVAWAEPPDDPGTTAADPSNAPGPGGVPGKTAQVFGVEGQFTPGKGTPDLPFGISDFAKLEPGPIATNVAPPGPTVRIFTPSCVGSLGCP